MMVLMQRDRIEISQTDDELVIVIEQISNYGERSRIEIPFDSVDFFMEQFNEVASMHLGLKNAG